MSVSGIGWSAAEESAETLKSTKAHLLLENNVQMINSTQFNSVLLI